MNYASMARSYERSRRREVLTFRHHQEAASIKQIAEDKDSYAAIRSLVKVNTLGAD